MTDGRYRISIFNALQASPLIPSSRRARWLRRFGFDIDPSAIIYENVFFGSRSVRIERDCFISVNCFLDGSDLITIGAGVSLGPHVKLITSTHDPSDSTRRAGRMIKAPITIGPGSWIGAGAMLLPGVEIAAGCIIAAGAVVTASTAPHGVYAGMPATRKKDLPL